MGVLTVVSEMGGTYRGEWVSDMGVLTVVSEMGVLTVVRG